MTNTRLVISFTTQNGFQAEDLLIGLVVPVTPDEKEFVDGIDLWGEALRHQQEKEKGTEKPPGTGNSNN